MARASRFTLVSEADLAPSRSTEMRQEPTEQLGSGRGELQIGPGFVLR
jgi:hypothetical protein